MVSRGWWIRVSGAGESIVMRMRMRTGMKRRERGFRSLFYSDIHVLGLLRRDHTHFLSISLSLPRSPLYLNNIMVCPKPVPMHETVNLQPQPQPALLPLLAVSLILSARHPISHPLLSLHYDLSFISRHSRRRDLGSQLPYFLPSPPPKPCPLISTLPASLRRSESCP